MNKSFHKCRLCLKLGDFCSIFEEDDAIKLSEMVMSFANVKILEGDGLSDRVCSSCIENISTAYLFKLQCERTNALLIKNPDIKSEEPPSAADYNILLSKEFFMHEMESNVEGQNNQNCLKDANIIHEVSDETDSDIDSVKCVYCNESYSNFGGHKCQVTCTIENNELQRSSSNETLVATDRISLATPPPHNNTYKVTSLSVSCVLCDQKYDQYDDYVLHVNECTRNVKLQYFVCPVCHEIYPEKLSYLQHLKRFHFDVCTPDSEPLSSSIDCVDFAPTVVKTSKPKSVRRQIGWSVEDIYQEIECKKIDEKVTPTSSPLKTFLNKLGNETFSRQSTPKKVSFRRLIEDGKAKTSNYIPFRKSFLSSFRKKTTEYSPVKGKLQISTEVQASLSDTVSDSEYHSASGTSEDSWKLKQSLVCACDRKMFMLSESLNDRLRLGAMVAALGGLVAENTRMEMLATHYVARLPADTLSGAAVCALATGKHLLHVSYVYDSFRCKKFMDESVYEWRCHPRVLELDATSAALARAAAHWARALAAPGARRPFEGARVVLVLRRKYRQYYSMLFRALRATPLAYDPRTPGTCCAADYCFVDTKVADRARLRYFAAHGVPVLPYQYILVFLLNKGRADDEHKYRLDARGRGALNNTC